MPKTPKILMQNKIPSLLFCIPKLTQNLKSFAISSISLILVNLIPLFGVLFFNWTLFSILFLYWLESAIIGFFTLVKMIASLAFDAKNLRKTNFQFELFSLVLGFILLPFFVFHFSTFMLGHLIFIFVVSGLQKVSSLQSALTNFNLLDILFGLIFPFLALFLSHTISFFSNYIAKKEYSKKTVKQLMFSPYKRIIIMHLTVILGAFIILKTNSHSFVIALLVLLKIAVDLHEHKKEHLS